MGAVLKLGTWVFVGISLLLSHYYLPRDARDLRQGIALLFVAWLLLCLLWFARTLFRWVVR